MPGASRMVLASEQAGARDKEENMTRTAEPTAFVVIFHERQGDRVFVYSDADALRDDLVNVPPSTDEPADLYRVRDEDGGTDYIGRVADDLGGNLGLSRYLATVPPVPESVTR